MRRVRNLVGQTAVVAAANFLLLLGCDDAQGQRAASARCEPGITYQNDAIIYCGPVNQTLLSALRVADKRNIKRVIISSEGGEIEVAIEAADVIAQKRLTLEIREVCLSACAQFLLAPTPNAVIAPGTLVAFHTTETSMRLLGLRRDLEGWEALADATAKVSTHEKQFYMARGIDPALLVDPLHAMEVACVGRRVSMVGGRPSVEYLAKWLWWIPSMKQMEAYGMPPKVGSWLHLADFAAVMAAERKYGLRSVTFTGPNVRREEEEMRSLPFCR
jgi:hypothetical protein